MLTGHCPRGIISPVGGVAHMFRPKNKKEQILHRLKITKGHLEKIISMVEENNYCIDVLHQSQAVQAGLKQADNIILEHHLLTCAADAISKGKKDEAIAEVMNVFRRKNN